MQLASHPKLAKFQNQCSSSKDGDVNTEQNNFFNSLITDLFMRYAIGDIKSIEQIISIIKHLFPQFDTHLNQVCTFWL